MKRIAEISENPLEHHYLFVCSANTCRSPLAAVIMRNEVARKLQTDIAGIEEQGYLIRSAGPWANRGAGITYESRQVLAEMGYPVPSRGARELGTGLITDAAEIFAMTQWHIDRVLDLAPNAGHKIRLLDPSGRDIPDPISMGIDVYRDVGKKIQAAVQQIVAGIFQR
jgi:protein-tyrosine phosphatase